MLIKRLMRLKRQGSGKQSVHVQQDTDCNMMYRSKRDTEKSSYDEKKEKKLQRKRLMRLERQGRGKRSVRVEQNTDCNRI